MVRVEGAVNYCIIAYTGRGELGLSLYDSFIMLSVFTYIKPDH
jgi:hypothetical protein